MNATAMSPVGTSPVVDRSPADRFMRRVLRLPVDAPRQSILGAENAFGKSILISATRCLITYVALPLLAPVVHIAGSIGPILGLVLGAVSMTSIVFSMRRFFASDHKYRWYYATLGSALLVLLSVAAVVDLVTLLT